MAPGVQTLGSWFPLAVFRKDMKRLSAHGGGCVLRRSLSISRPVSAKVPPARRPREPVHIPGLEPVTYGEKMHFVPGLAKPVHPHWERDYRDPGHYRAPPAHQMPLSRDQPCYVYNQRTSALEGVRQALWLTKAKLVSGLPSQLLSLAKNPANQIVDQDERVKAAIKHARFWDLADGKPPKHKYSNTLLHNLLHLCTTLQDTHPALGRRLLAEKYSLAATWKRGDNLFQVRGQNGLLLNSLDPVPAVSVGQEVSDTAEHVLETFYPVSPAIDLQKVHVYQEEVNCTGFREDYPYHHAHTLFFMEGGGDGCRLRPEQFRAKMIMFTFGNALARAHRLYGARSESTLDQPITVQAVGTNGRIFQFMVFQLNTTDLTGDDGIKNQVWLDEDVELYDFAKVRSLIKKKEVKVPAGLAGYKPETFNKFLALFLHGVV